MTFGQPQETLVERHVNYTVEVDGELYMIENVPARVCLETGEPFFSAETVERIHQIISEGRRPTRKIEASVYDFAA